MTKTTLPGHFTRFSVQIVYVLILPVFFLVFMTLYRPERLVAFFTMERDLFAFNVTILSCIMLGVVLISRTLMLLVSRSKPMRLIPWLLWQFFECVAMSLFMALYMALMYHHQFTFYHVEGYTFASVLLIDIFPYIVLGLGLALVSSRETVVESDSLIRFRDSQKQVKFMISAAAVLYVEAQENYVLIHYMDGDVVKEYSLRSSMIAIEPLMNKHGLVRCQRSYYINPEHVKVLRKDKEGVITAELNTPHQKAIPVSAKYYSELAEKL